MWRLEIAIGETSIRGAGTQHTLTPVDVDMTLNAFVTRLFEQKRMYRWAAHGSGIVSSIGPLDGKSVITKCEDGPGMRKL